MRWIWIAALGAALAACEDDAPDGTGLTVEVLAEQPASGAGIAVAVHARGGLGLELSLDRGDFVGPDATGDADEVPVSGRAACFPSPWQSDQSDQPFTVHLVVHPDGADSTLFASLHAASSCTGVARHTTIAVVRVPIVTAPADAALVVDGEAAPDAEVTP